MPTAHRVFAGFTAMSLLTACSSLDQPRSGTPVPSSSTQSSISASPTTIPGTPHDEPVILHKQPGQKAAIGCGEEPNSPCDVEFAVSNIKPGLRCTDAYPPLGANEQLIRFDIEIWTAPTFKHPDIATVFFLDHWGIGDTEGVDNDLESHTVIDCEGQVIGDQIQKTLMPGTHVVKTVVLTAPRGATTLRLYSNPIGDGWTWDIPTGR